MLAEDHFRPGRRLQRQAAHAVELRLDGLDHAPDGWVAGQPRELGMERLVEAEEAHPVSRLHRLGLLRHQRVEAGAALLVKPLGGERDGAAFQRLAYELAVIDRSKIDRSDEGADLGTTTRKPSSTSRLKASRTGVRLTPKRNAMRASDIAAPGSSAAPRISALRDRWIWSVPWRTAEMVIAIRGLVY